MCRSVQLNTTCFRVRCAYAHHVSEFISVVVQDAVPAQFTAAASSATDLKESPPVVPQQKASDPKLHDILNHGSAAASNAAIVSRSVQELEGADAGGWVKVVSPNGRSQAPFTEGIFSSMQHKFMRSVADIPLLPRETIAESIDLTLADAVTGG